MVPSQEAETMRRLSCEKEHELIGLVWPRRRLTCGQRRQSETHDTTTSSQRTSAPLAGSQITSEQSHEAERTRWPSCENEHALTRFSWPLSVCTQAPVSLSHRRRVPSHEAEMMVRPSGEYLQSTTQFVWPCSVASSLPDFASQT